MSEAIEIEMFEKCTKRKIEIQIILLLKFLLVVVCIKLVYVRNPLVWFLYGTNRFRLLEIHCQEFLFLQHGKDY